MPEQDEHKEFYELVCQPTLNTHGRKLDQILNILSGKNGDAGLCEQVRELQRIYKRVGAAVVFIIVALVLEFVSWGWGQIVSMVN
jgi:hypothetical protein